MPFVSIDAHGRGLAALDHILDAISGFREAVGDLTLPELVEARVRYAASERFVEIISEASRRLPDPWKTDYPDTPWPDIASIGNVIRHRYDAVDREVIYEMRGHALDALERVVVSLKARYGSAKN